MDDLEVSADGALLARVLIAALLVAVCVDMYRTFRINRREAKNR